MSTKFNVSFDEDVFNRFEEFSTKKGVNRSALLSIAIQQYMDAQEKIEPIKGQFDELSEMMPILKEFCEKMKGELDGVKL